MKKTLLVLCCIVLAATTAVSVWAQEDDALQEKIDNAMSAAPLAISADATIIDNYLDDDGNHVVLREGTNEWTCMVALEETPTNDPACFDEVWMDWNDALFFGTDFEPTEVGLAYMLQGGSVASNEDPSLLEPPDGEDWFNSPPHVMVIVPGGLADSDLPTMRDEEGVWIMYGGTPLEHIMMLTDTEFP